MRDGLEADLSNFSLGQPESRGKAHAHRMNLLVPLFFFCFIQVTNEKKEKKEQTDSYGHLHTPKKEKKRKLKGGGRKKGGKIQNATFTVRRTAQSRVMHRSNTRALCIHVSL